MLSRYPTCGTCTAQNIPYYRAAFSRAGFTPEDFEQESVLQRLPFLTKAILQEEFAPEPELNRFTGFEVMTAAGW